MFIKISRNSKDDIYYCVNVVDDYSDVPYNKFIFRRFEDDSVYLIVNLLMENVFVDKSSS